MVHLKLFPKGVVTLDDLFIEQKRFILEATARLDFPKYMMRVRLLSQLRQAKAMSAKECLDSISPELARILEKEIGYSKEMLHREGELKKKELIERIERDLKQYG